eukprot:GILJ01010917.1.p1 GENE.GILJ01010917.1~~GILJ01010917.1.p1  ORF type:complete len:692 (+),score=113.50 GILJ01010917.1:50-2125(+)
MIHDLLLALSGFPGDIIVMSADGQRFYVDPKIDFLSESDKVEINGICMLGAFYKHIDDFVSLLTCFDPPLEVNGDKTDQKRAFGIYVRALCLGLEEITEEYRQCLLEFEQEFLQDPGLTIGHLHVKLLKFDTLLPALDRLVKDVQATGCKGGQLLEMLFNCSVSGNPIVEENMNRLRFHCHRVLYQQIAAWMIHGILVDRYNEFFIHRLDDPHTDVSKPFESAGTDEDIHITVTSSSSKDAHHEKEWRLFGLRTAMLPVAYLPLRLAEEVLFVGKAMRVLRHPKANPEKTLPADEMTRFLVDLTQLQTNPSFDLPVFQKCINTIRASIAHKLWTLVVPQSGLMTDLLGIKEYFLLGKGEFYQAFLEETRLMLSLPPSITAEHDINAGPLLQTGLRLGIEDEELFNKIRFRLKTVAVGTVSTGPTDSAPANAFGGLPLRPASGFDSTKNKAVSADGWRALCLEYKVKWPLHLIITQDVLERYNRLFAFLFSVRRVQFELQRCWLLLLRHKTVSTNFKHNSSICQLRTHMSYLIDNLFMYLELDVLAIQFNKLQQAIESSTDFETVRRSHEDYLVTITSQCFVCVPQIMKALDDVFDKCYKFCQLVQRVYQSDQSRPWSIEILNEFAAIRKEFERQSSFVFTILSGFKGHHSSLAQLLLRFDYNRYFTTVAANLGSEARPPAATLVPAVFSRS